MLEELFRGNEVAQSTLLGVATSLLTSFCLSFLLVVTYRLTSREVTERREFTQGLALISLVACMIMQAIGDSLARGLGMLGALSIIRFRTSLTSPRNMAFMFASLAVGIACGVFGFVIALAGTVVFCAVAIALSLEYRDGGGADLTGEVRVTLDADPAAAQAFERLVGGYTRRLRLTERRIFREKPPKPPSPELAPTANGEADAVAGTLVAADNGVARAPRGHDAAGTTTAVAPPPAPPLSERPLRQTLTYAFRLREARAAPALYDALAAHLPDANHRLRFTREPETL